MKGLQTHALVWNAGSSRYRLDGDLAVPQGGVGVVVTQDPAAAIAFVDVLMGLTPVSGGGTVMLDGADVTRLPPHCRRISLVPEGGGLLPHRTVEGNIAYGLGGGAAVRAHRGRVDDVIDRLRLNGIRRMRPHELSAEERLTVAVARALCRHPEPVAVVIEDRPVALRRQKNGTSRKDQQGAAHGRVSCRVAVATAVDQEVAVIAVTGPADGGADVRLPLLRGPTYHRVKEMTDDRRP